MCKWRNKTFRYGRGQITINANVIRDACQIIWQSAQRRQLITYTQLMNHLKALGHNKINRGTIGAIIGEVSTQVAQNTYPSVYPSAIVVRKGTNKPGNGFWGLNMGTKPPSEITPRHRNSKIQQYQNDVFTRNWNCNC